MPKLGASPFRQCNASSAAWTKMYLLENRDLKQPEIHTPMLRLFHVNWPIAAPGQSSDEGAEQTPLKHVSLARGPSLFLSRPVAQRVNPQYMLVRNPRRRGEQAYWRQARLYPEQARAHPASPSQASAPPRPMSRASRPATRDTRRRARSPETGARSPESGQPADG